MNKRPLALTKTDKRQFRAMNLNAGGAKNQFEMAENYRLLLSARLEVSGLDCIAHGKTGILVLYKKEMVENDCLALLNEMRDVKY